MKLLQNMSSDQSTVIMFAAASESRTCVKIIQGQVANSCLVLEALK